MTRAWLVFGVIATIPVVVWAAMSAIDLHVYDRDRGAARSFLVALVGVFTTWLLWPLYLVAGLGYLVFRAVKVGFPDAGARVGAAAGRVYARFWGKRRARKPAQQSPPQDVPRGQSRWPGGDR